MHIAPGCHGPWSLGAKDVPFSVATPTAVLVARAVLGTQPFISPVSLTVCHRLEGSAQVARSET
jgi:hypothetical protein